MSAYATAFAPPSSESYGYGSSATSAATGKGNLREPNLSTGAEGPWSSAYGGSKGSTTADAKSSYAVNGKGNANGFVNSKPGGSKGGFPSSASAGPASSPVIDVEQFVALVPVRPYDFSEPEQEVIVGSRGALKQLRGIVRRPYAAGGKCAEFFLLKGLLSEAEVAEILATGSKVLSEMIASGCARDEDPTDGRPSFAVDLAPGGVYSGDLAPLLKQLVEDAVLPLVRDTYHCATACLSAARFRRFMQEERPFLPPHHDYGAFAAVTIGLQDLSAVTGGFFLQGSGRAFLDRRFVGLGRGDALFHQSDVHHGVEVREGTRLELCLIFKDTPQAIPNDISPWYAKGAHAGDPCAQLGYGLSSRREGDVANARAWLEKACEQDHPDALYALADLIWEEATRTGNSSIGLDSAGQGGGDARNAIGLFRRAAELGHGKSLARLGAFLIQGVEGRVVQDTWEGKRLLRLAFEQDNPDAGFHLGQALLKEGDRDGVTKLLSASLKGHPRACFHIAEMYREGQYQFPINLQKSLRYTKWAAHQGDALAMSNLGHLIINGLGVIRDDAKAVRLFRQAAKRGAGEGQLNYALALLRGTGGVRVNYQEALEWAQKAAGQGHALAHQQLPMFFNAAKNPNPPARCLPTTRSELCRLSIRELQDLLRVEGIDYTDCIEKGDLVARAAQHLLSAVEPWDAAPDHTLLLDPPKKSKEELLERRRQQERQKPITETLPNSPSSKFEAAEGRASTPASSSFTSTEGRASASTTTPALSPTGHGATRSMADPAVPAPKARPAMKEFGSHRAQNGHNLPDVARPCATSSTSVVSGATSTCGGASPASKPTRGSSVPVVDDDEVFEIID